MGSIATIGGMRAATMSFRPRLLPTIAALAGLALTVSASLWQFGRGQDKDHIVSRSAASMAGPPLRLGLELTAEQAIRFQRIAVRGEFLADQPVFLDNQARGTVPGYNVFMPLRITGGTAHVLVKRGWTPAPGERTTEPVVSTPPGEIEIEGLALPPNSRFLELSSQTQAGRIWQNVTLERVALMSGLTFHPLILEQHNPIDDALVRDWPAPASGSAKHYGYAFQWGAMAVLVLILYVVLNVRRNPASPPAA